MPDSTPDQVTAYLDEMWRRWNAVGPESGAVMLAGPVGASAMDVPALLAAVRRVLKLHHRQEAPCRSYDYDLRCHWHSHGYDSALHGAIRDCPDCKYRETHPCTHCRDEDWPCPTVEAISAALLGEVETGASA